MVKKKHNYVQNEEAAVKGVELWGQNKLQNYVINMCRLPLNTKTVRAKEKSSMSKQSNVVA